MPRGACDRCHRSYQLNPESRFQPTCPRCSRPLRRVAQERNRPVPLAPPLRAVTGRPRWRTAPELAKRYRQSFRRAFLVVLLLSGLGLLVGWFLRRPAWVAAHRGVRANLRGAALRGARLPGAVLAGADLSWVDLTGANLRGANLRGASLHEATLQRVDLRGGLLHAANLHHTNLQAAQLQAADLRGADLVAADLRGADLQGADLTGAKLFYSQADIQAMQPLPSGPPEVRLNTARLTGARYNSRTRWPAGFDPVKYGALVVKQANNP
jgi:uncharacterized protein YjbI with pentapeptide repeats